MVRSSAVSRLCSSTRTTIRLGERIGQSIHQPLFLTACFPDSTVGNKVSLIFSMYTVGSMVGAFAAGPIADKWGRRMGMFAGGLVIVTGCIVSRSSGVLVRRSHQAADTAPPQIVSSAKHFEQLIGGRFILGFGIAIMTVGAPSLCVEVSACLSAALVRQLMGSPRNRSPRLTGEASLSASTTVAGEHAG